MPELSATRRTRSIEARALALLERYDCPMSFHAVRTHFLGVMSAPTPVHPLKTLAHIWGGSLPPLPSIDAVNELLDGLINGFWNALTVHQDADHPFQLTPLPRQATRESLACVAKTRAEELDGFLTGVFGDQEKLNVPDPMGQSLESLMDLEDEISNVQTLLDDPDQATGASVLEGIGRQLVELTATAEREIHAVVMAARNMRELDDALEQKAASVVH